MTTELREPDEAARAWVTLYLSSAHRELREEIAEYVAGVTPEQVALTLEVLVAGIGETFGTREEWSTYVVEVMQKRGESE